MLRWVVLPCLFALPASAATFQYEYTFEIATHWATVDLDSQAAVERTATVGYDPLVRLSFMGGSNLSGATVNIIDDIGFQTGRLTGIVDPYENQSGFVTFNDDGSAISDWYFEAYTGLSEAGYSWQHMSDPRLIELETWSDWGDASNTEMFVGMPHYGEQYTEPNSVWYNLSPGRWSLASTELIHAPLPASGWLMLAGLSAFWLVRRAAPLA